MWLSASTSWAQRLSMIFTGPWPKMSRWKMSDRLAWGSTENTKTFCPRLASHHPVAAENVVFPSPPLPPNMMYRRSGCSSNVLASEVAPARMDSAMSEHRVRDVFLPQHPPLPRGDLRRDVWEQS